GHRRAFRGARLDRGNLRHPAKLFRAHAGAVDRSGVADLMHASSTHLVLIPSYNPGNTVFDTVAKARAQWNPVWVVVDGSTDGTEQGLRAMEKSDPGLRVLQLAQNSGKGAAILF